MKDRDQPSTLLRYSAPTAFLAMTIGALAWFVFGAIDTAHQLLTDAEVVSFNKGVFYMLGVGIGLAVLSFVLVYEYWLGKPLTNTMTTVCTRIGIGSVAVIFLLPQIVHSQVENYVKDKGYEICPGASHQWLHSRTIVYVSNMGLCFELTQKNK